MAKRNAYLLVFDGLADWEPAHALCLINGSDRFDVVTAGLSAAPITTMGGLRITPDCTLADIQPADTAILIVPGGTMWEESSQPALIDLLHRLHAAQVPIAAICGATLEIARAGLMRGRGHTSNAPGYVQDLVPEYDSAAEYVDALAVADRHVITASGLGCVEFAREIALELGIFDQPEAQIWFDMFKHGKYPQTEAA